MRYDSEHKARTRERVLKEAAAAIRADGIDRVGVAGIMARADLTQGGFYAHFKSKDDLIAEAIGYMFDERYARFLERLNHPDARQALSEFIDYYLSPRHCAALEHGCPIPALAGDIPRMTKKARARFAAGVDRLTAGLAELLGKIGIADPETQSHALLAELAGALCLARVRTQEADAAAILAGAQKDLKRRLGLTA